jgi:hypothetical protein
MIEKKFSMMMKIYLPVSDDEKLFNEVEIYFPESLKNKYQIFERETGKIFKRIYDWETIEETDVTMISRDEYFHIRLFHDPEKEG